MLWVYDKNYALKINAFHHLQYFRHHSPESFPNTIIPVHLQSPHKLLIPCHKLSLIQYELSVVYLQLISITVSLNSGLSHTSWEYFPQETAGVFSRECVLDSKGRITNVARYLQN